MADVRLSQVVGLTEASGQSARLSQVVGLMESSGQSVRLSQVVGLIEADKVQIRISQVVGLIEAEYVPPVTVGVGDIPAAGGASSSSSGGGSSPTLSPSGTKANTTGGGSGSSGAGSSPTLSPSAQAPSTTRATPTGSASAPKTLSPSATKPRGASGSAGGVQVERDSEGSASWTPAPSLPTSIGTTNSDGKFTAELYNRSGHLVILPDLELNPLNYSATAIGGADQASIDVGGAFPALWSALNWLGYSVRIFSPLGRQVWEGIIERTSVSTEAYSMGLSLRPMVNRVQVAYTRTIDQDATAESLITDWAQDAASIAKYGTKELKTSLADGSQAQAESLRDTVLATGKIPQTVIDISGGAPGAQLSAVGRWLALEWQYYTNDDGYVLYEPESVTDEIIGFALTGTLGFREDGIFDLEMRLSVLESGARIIVSGTDDNDGTYTINSAPNTTIDDQVVYTGDAFFTPLDDVSFGLPQLFTAGEMIEIADSDSNDGYYWIKRIIPADRFEVRNGGIVAEDENNVTITQGHHATCSDSRFTTEVTAATLSSYSKVAQKFTPTSSWDAQDILLMLARTGTPADEIQVSIYTDDSGAPDTLQESGTVAAIDVDESLGWVEVQLDDSVSVSASTDYWVVVERTGAADDENFWRIGMSDELVSGAAALVWNGSAWITHPGNLDCALRVWGTVDSAVKAALVAESSDYTNWADQRATTGTRVRLYSDGTKRISEELQALIDAGDDDDKRLSCWFDGSVFVVDVEQADDGTLGLAQDGRLLSLPAQELEAGVLPVRRWLRVIDMPPGALYDTLTPVYIEAASYSVGKGLRLESKANLTAWDML